MAHLAALSTSNADASHIDVGFVRFLKRIHKMPMLSSDEELNLTRHYAQFKDPASAQKIVNSHLKLVSRIAVSYSGYGLAINDLVAEGTIGLMRALDKFDPESGNRFSTYAQWWIKSSINEYVIKSWSMVRIGTTAAQKKLFFNLRRMKNELMLHSQDKYLSNGQIIAIANELNVKPDEVSEMEQRMSGNDMSLNMPLAEGENDEWQDLILDDAENHEEKFVEKETVIHKQQLLRQGMSKLNDREREIFIARRLQSRAQTLDELSQIHHISKERVRQIDNQAFNKVQHFMLQKAKSDKLVL